MVQSKAKTVEEYLESLPDDRRNAIAAVRSVILANLPKGMVETMASGMISYEIPLERYPKTYNKRPLMYAGLAAQKNYNTLYLMGAYAQPHELEAAFKKAGKKLDMGKSCVHFKTADDLPLDVIGDAIGSVTVQEWIEIYEKSRK